MDCMVHIGVTGHRLLINIDRITAGIDQALEHIERAYPGTATLYSSLAEGADRLVVKRFLMHHAGEIIVPLPLPLDEYVKDFSSAASTTEFYQLLAEARRVVCLPKLATREEAYRAAGVYILDHVDLLVALWDGQEPRGVGGAGEIVAEARRRKLPIIWVQSQNGRVNGGFINTQAMLVGGVSYENF